MPESTKRIGIITYDYYPFIGGMGRYIHEITTRLSQNPSMKFIVFNPWTAGQDQVKTLSLLAKAGKNIAFSAYNAKLSRWVKDYKLDLVHLQGGPGGSFYWCDLPVPVIFTAYHTYFQQYRLVHGQSWKAVLRMMEKRSYRRSDHIVTISKDTATVLIEKYGISNDDLTIVPCGIDEDIFKPIPEVEKRQNEVLFVGRFEQRKGLDLLLAAAERVQRRIPDLRIVLAGGNPEGKWVSQLTKEFGLAGKIVFPERLSDKQLARLYNEASLVVVPSVFEGFGLTAIEAMACGTPVIATEVFGLRELIQTEVDGLLVPYGDVAALSSAMLRLLLDKQLGEGLARAALPKVIREYKWDVQSRRMRDVYNSVLAV